MKTKLLALALLAGGSMFAQTRFSVGIGVGPGYQSAPAYAYRMARPGPDYIWVDGYWAPTGWRNRWIPGYWMRQPYRSGYYVAPRYEQPRYENRYDNRRGDDRGFDRNRNYENGFRNR